MIDSQLIEALSTPEESQRRYAAEEISESGDPEAATVLVSQLHKEGARAVKEAILRGLSRIWTSNPVGSIIELLRDDDPFVRAEAAGMLQRRAGDVIEGLNRLMRSDDKDLRKFSVDILREATIGAPDALYLAALKDKDVNVVISAIENIGSRRRTGLAKPVLAMAMESSQPMAVCASLEALALIGTRQTLDALRAKYPNAAEVPGIYLQPFLKLLGHTAGPESVEEICRTIEQKGEFIHEVAIDALTNIALRHNVSQLNSWCEACSAAFSNQNSMRACAFISSVFSDTSPVRRAWPWWCCLIYTTPIGPLVWQRSSRSRIHPIPLSKARCNPCFRPRAIRRSPRN